MAHHAGGHLRRGALIALALLALAGCAQRPVIGIQIGTPSVKDWDCVPGSSTRPCE